MRTTFLLLSALIALVVLLLRLAGILLVFAVQLVGAILRVVSRLTTTTSVRVSPGSVLR